MRISAMSAGLFAICAAAFPVQAHSQEQEIVPLLALSEVLALAETNRSASLERIERILPLLPPEDIRIRFDLNALRAELLLAAGRVFEAAEWTAQLAESAVQYRAVLQEDPAPIWKEAARLFELAGDDYLAREAVLQQFELERDAGLTPAQMQPTLDQIGSLSEKIGDGFTVADVPLEEAFIVSNSKSGDGGDGAADGFREVDVYYATDRARSGLDTPDDFYGYGRGELERGIARVTIPATHVPGVLEAPSIWKLEFGPNPAKHIMLHSVMPVEPDAFYSRMTNHMAQEDVSSAFVFIHGYNVSFDQAARRAAQLSYDTAFPGIPILYSWPSRGSTAGYVADTAVVRLSGRRLSRFLDELVEHSGATTIHIVAHSMGNRALTDALELMALRRGVKAGDTPVFDQVLFAAPDVDAELFAEMMPTIRPIAKRLTLYASEQDWALATSRHLHGDAPRAGQGGVDMIARPEFDSVDMSALGEDMLAHSYFAGDRSALADMVALFWRNAAPELRCGLEPKAAEAGEIPIWQYLKGACADSELVKVFGHLQRANVQDMRSAEKIVAEKVKDKEKAKVILPVLAKLLGN